MLDGMLSDIGPSKIYYGKLDCPPPQTKAVEAQYKRTSLQAIPTSVATLKLN